MLRCILKQVHAIFFIQHFVCGAIVETNTVFLQRETSPIWKPSGTFSRIAPLHRRRPVRPPAVLSYLIIPSSPLQADPLRKSLLHTLQASTTVLNLVMTDSHPQIMNGNRSRTLHMHAPQGRPLNLGMLVVKADARGLHAMSMLPPRQQMSIHDKKCKLICFASS